MEQKFDINRVINDAKRVITKPAEYYSTMAKTGGFSDPIIFVVVMAAAMGLITAILSFFGSPIGLMAAGIGAIIIVPIAAVISSFIGAAILFVIWKLMGSEQTFETAYRCLAAAAAIYPIIAILSIIPYIGSIVGVAWGAYLLIEASVIVHDRNRQKATIVFCILGALMIISNVSSEYASRHLAERAEEMSKQFENYQNLPPEEMGKKMGEFLKGMEETMEDKK